VRNTFWGLQDSHCSSSEQLHRFSSDNHSCYNYGDYWNRSRPCIILDSKIPRLVLETFPKVLCFGQLFLDQNIQKSSNKLFLMHL